MSVPQDELAAGDDYEDDDDYDPTAFLQTEFVEGDNSIGETDGTEENTTSNHKDSQDNNNDIGASTTAQNNDDDDVEVKNEPLEFVECS